MYLYICSPLRDKAPLPHWVEGGSYQMRKGENLWQDANVEFAAKS